MWALELHDVFSLKNTGLPGQCLKANRRERCAFSQKKVLKKFSKLLIRIKLHGTGFTEHAAATWGASVSCSILHYCQNPQLLQARFIADMINFTATKKLHIYSSWEYKAAGNTAFYLHPTASLTTKLQG